MPSTPTTTLSFARAFSPTAIPPSEMAVVPAKPCCSRPSLCSRFCHSIATKTETTIVGEQWTEKKRRKKIVDRRRKGKRWRVRGREARGWSGSKKPDEEKRWWREIIHLKSGLSDWSNFRFIDYNLSLFIPNTYALSLKSMRFHIINFAICFAKINV